MGTPTHRWLTMAQASAFLGIDQATLRRWSDAGKVPCYRTPGRHRRYAEADLRALLGAAGDTAVTRDPLAAEPELRACLALLTSPGVSTREKLRLRTALRAAVAKWREDQAWAA